jgi:cytochrome-b5 reductase
MVRFGTRTHADKVSGGTGITPFYQLINGVFSAVSEGRLPRTRFTLLHSSPTPLDLPPRSILGPLQLFAQLYPESISIQLYVDAMDPKASRVDLPRLALGRIGRKALEQAVAPRSVKTDWWWTKLWSPSRRADVARRKILFLVCGPEPYVPPSMTTSMCSNDIGPSMIGAIAGPRVQTAHEAVIGGVLGEMGFEPHQVCKL